MPGTIFIYIYIYIYIYALYADLTFRYANNNIFFCIIIHQQVYHQCLFGLRYDFLCANYTAFDQKIFNCHFANEVDCVNSPKFYDR